MSEAAKTLEPSEEITEPSSPSPAPPLCHRCVLRGRRAIITLGHICAGTEIDERCGLCREPLFYECVEFNRIEGRVITTSVARQCPCSVRGGIA